MIMYQKIKELKAQYIEDNNSEEPSLLILGIDNNHQLMYELLEAYGDEVKLSQSSCLGLNILGMTIIPIFRKNFFACARTMKELDSYNEVRSKNITT